MDPGQGPGHERDLLRVHEVGVAQVAQVLGNVPRSVVPAPAHVGAGIAAEKGNARVRSPNVRVISAGCREVAQHAGKRLREQPIVADLELG